MVVAMKYIGIVLTLVIIATYPVVSFSYDWPPQVGEHYPDLRLFNSAGETIQLSDFKGKVIVIESIIS